MVLYFWVLYFWESFFFLFQITQLLWRTVWIYFAYWGEKQQKNISRLSTKGVPNWIHNFSVLSLNTLPHCFLYFCLHCFPNYSNFKISSDALFSPTTNFMYLFTAMSFLSTPFLQPHCSSLTLAPFILYLVLFHFLPIG